MTARVDFCFLPVLAIGGQRCDLPPSTRRQFNDTPASPVLSRIILVADQTRNYSNVADGVPALLNSSLDAIENWRNVFETIRSFVDILANKEREGKGNAAVNSGAPTKQNEFAAQKLRRYLDDVSPRSWKTISPSRNELSLRASLETLLATYTSTNLAMRRVYFYESPSENGSPVAHLR